MEDKIVLKDGTEIEGGSIAPSTMKQIYISIPGTDLVSAVQTFSNPEKTGEMTFFYSVYKKVYTDYTQIDSVGIGPNGNTVDLYMSGENGKVETTLTVAAQYVPESMRP